MSIEPLCEYFNILNKLGRSNVDRVDSSSSFNLKKVKHLLGDGCVTGSDVSDLDEDAFLNVSITPKGAVVLAEWNSIIERKSLSFRFRSVLEKTVWMSVGMMFTVAGQLVNSFIKNFW